eukprot:CAMPEP_0177627312 /NCGR_PEP_ID=MMETSP0419_2-20121207/31134_1 /TAXON_ID=582737 /ORGANISM="Tetraselmis sp., Strain GSL018" /LENGTH=307 /DNA_ID=CAMNT_0019128453 /DNA_START=179 /DNA_END=1102 /DNA_ORIENTATION=-
MAIHRPVISISLVSHGIPAVDARVLAAAQDRLPVEGHGSLPHRALEAGRRQLLQTRGALEDVIHKHLPSAVAHRHELVPVVQGEPDEPDVRAREVVLLQVLHVVEAVGLALPLAEVDPPQKDAVVDALGEDQVPEPPHAVHVVAVHLGGGELGVVHKARRERAPPAVPVERLVHGGLESFVAPDLHHVVHPAGGEDLGLAGVEVDAQDFVPVAAVPVEDYHTGLGLQVPQPKGLILAGSQEKFRLGWVHFDVVYGIPVTDECMHGVPFVQVYGPDETLLTAKQENQRTRFPVDCPGAREELFTFIVI